MISWLSLNPVISAAEKSAFRVVQPAPLAAVPAYLLTNREPSLLRISTLKRGATPAVGIRLIASKLTVRGLFTSSPFKRFSYTISLPPLPAIAI